MDTPTEKQVREVVSFLRQKGIDLSADYPFGGCLWLQDDQVICLAFGDADGLWARVAGVTKERLREVIEFNRKVCSADDLLCAAKNKDGKPCRNRVERGGPILDPRDFDPEVDLYCRVHRPKGTAEGGIQVIDRRRQK